MHLSDKTNAVGKNGDSRDTWERFDHLQLTLSILRQSDDNLESAKVFRG